MHEINVTELRAHLPKYLARAERGTEILVTSHGKVVARLMPPVDTQSHALAQLKLLRKRCKIGDVISPLDEEWNAQK